MKSPHSTEAVSLQLAIQTLQEAVGHARSGLPEDVFLLVSSLTPLINVDLLVKNEAGQTLLTWRHDNFYGPGWHVPGGIIRFKETAANRVSIVAEKELGARVSFSPEPVQITEIRHPNRDVRGHFISMLYACRLESELEHGRKFKQEAPCHGHWQWHSSAPADLIQQHNIYKDALSTSWVPTVKQKFISL